MVLYKEFSFCPDPIATCPPQAILVSDWSISKKIYSSETTWSNEPKLGMIYGRSSMKFANLVPIS
jgi:hypothetical protein